MKIVKGTEKEFVKVFGKEGLALASKHKVDIYLCKAGDFPMIDAVSSDVGGCVLRLDPQTLEVLPQESYGKISMLLYPENLKKGSDHVRKLSTNIGQALTNEVNRFIVSNLVHELTHVKQMTDGRMNVIRFGLVEWDGDLIDVTVGNHLTLPWEREAYLAQYEHILQSPKKALKAYNDMVFNHQAAEHNN